MIEPPDDDHVSLPRRLVRMRAEGRIGRDIDLGHLSPALYGHVNPYGKYRFEIEARAPDLRPLRSPGNDA